ncbi:hypothetical protein KGS77_33150 [Streptomyces sp. MST-110588]|nr:hypothetical protein KGS77_33150 [Streptomyces sp. MST-110588]
MDTAVAETGMEYGGTTPIGLPGTWPFLIDEAVVATPYVLTGSGRRCGKLILPGSALAQLPGDEKLPDFCVNVHQRARRCGGARRAGDGDFDDAPLRIDVRGLVALG